MKRHLALLLTLATLTLISCGTKDNNQNTPTEPSDPATANVEYTISGGSDMLLLFDIEAEYTDAAGNTATETVATLPWSKSLQELELPYTAELNINITAREEYEARETYQVGLGGGISYTTTDGRIEHASTASTMNIAAKDVAAYQERTVSRTHTFTEEIAAAE